MRALLGARGNQTDHPFVPTILVEADAYSVLDHTGGLAAGDHIRLDVPTGTIQRVQFTGHGQGGLRLVAEQAGNPLPHVLEPASGVQARAHHEAQRGGIGVLGLPAGDLQQRIDAGAGPPGTNPGQTLGDKDTVVVIQRHDVRHRAQRHKIEQPGQRQPVAAQSGA